MELEFTVSPGYTLPAYLQGKNSFILHIDVAQTNDPPFLFIPTSKMLKLAEVRATKSISFLTLYRNVANIDNFSFLFDFLF